MAQSLERRTQPRYQPGLPQALNVTLDESGESRILAAKLVDFTQSGVGVEMFAPLRAGTLVRLEGHLRSDEFSLRLNGRARVAHCRRQGNGNYRIGFALEEVAYRKSA